MTVREPRGSRTIRLLSIAPRNYLDDTDPRAATHRAFVVGLARAGLAVEVLTGSTLTNGSEVEPSPWLAARGWVVEATTIEPPAGTIAPAWPHPASHIRMNVDGVPVHLLGGPSTLPHDPDDAEVLAFLSILEYLLGRFRPDALVAHEADRLSAEALNRGRMLGLRTALRLRDRGPHAPQALATADAVLTPSRVLAYELHEATGRTCVPLPDFIDPAAIRAEPVERRYVAYFEPSLANGLPVFARVADELGRLRPDIPLLVIAGAKGRDALDGSGLDLKRHGNIALMSTPADPRAAWARAHVVLAPVLDGSCPPRAAAEAIINGLPVVASNRGGMPEILGDSGATLSLPDRITPATPLLPTPEEVAPWIEAVIRLWDDREHHAEHRRRAAAEARRWDAETQARAFADTFLGLRPAAGPIVPPPGRARWIVLVPHLHGIEPECEDGLHALESLGVRVVRRRGASGIDVARNDMASDALHDGFESILFVDADVAFDPHDALRLLARPEPVVAGLYAKKGPRELTSVFADGVAGVQLGAESPGLYPLKYAAAGFLRIRATALRRLIEGLNLPLCNLDWGRGSWPFFQPLIAEASSGRPHYLGEDWAFSHRVAQVGITPLADATIRLWHHGSYPFSWEDAGEERPRYRSYRLIL